MRDADVVEVRVDRGVRTLVAVCPHGREVRHGGGPITAPLSGYLGSRVSHVPCCRAYRLRLHPTA